MMQKGLAASLVLLVGACAAAGGDFAEQYSGGSFREMCDADQARCSAYVQGVRAGMRAQRLVMSFHLREAAEEAPDSIDLLLKGEPFCIPDGVSETEIAERVVKFIAENPPSKSESAAFPIVFALKKEYPCTAE